VHFVSLNNKKEVHIACPNTSILEWLNERDVKYIRHLNESNEAEHEVTREEEKEDEETMAIINEYNKQFD
jgi:hypothetical protein